MLPSPNKPSLPSSGFSSGSVLGAVLALFFLLLPFQFALAPREGVDLPFGRLCALVIGVLGCLTFFFRRNFRLSPAPTLLLLTFTLWASTSFLWAENTEYTFRKILFLFSYILLYPLCVALFSLREAYFRKVLTGALMGGGLASLIGIIQFGSQFVYGVSSVFHYEVEQLLPFFLGPEFAQVVLKYPSLLVNINGETVLRASGFFPDPHMFAYYLELLLPFAVLRVYERRSFFSILTLVLIGTALLLTFSRGAYVALLIAGCVGLISFGRRFLSGRFIFPLLLGGGLLVLLSTVPFIAARFQDIWSENDGSNVGRMAMYREAVEAMSEHPFLGLGLGNFPVYVLPSAPYREPIYAHNVFLDVGAELGLIGLMLFLGFMVAVAAVARRRSPQYRFGVLFMLLLFSLHGLFENPLFSVHVLPLFLLLTAVPASVVSRGRAHTLCP